MPEIALLTKISLKQLLKKYLYFAVLCKSISSYLMPQTILTSHLQPLVIFIIDHLVNTSKFQSLEFHFLMKCFHYLCPIKVSSILRQVPNVIKVPRCGIGPLD
jgi:hypothetical protein